MIVEFDKSFHKSLIKLKDKSLLKRIRKTIIDLESAKGLLDLPNSSKLSGYKTYYRIRIGDYRIGFESIDDSTIRLISIAHRKDIYRNFP